MFDLPRDPASAASDTARRIQKSAQAAMRNFYGFATSEGYRVPTEHDLISDAILLKIDARSYMQRSAGKPLKKAGTSITLDTNPVIRSEDGVMVFYHSTFAKDTQQFDSLDALLASDYRIDSDANTRRYLIETNRIV